MDDFLAYWGMLAWVQVLSARFMLHRKFDRTKIEPWTSGLIETFTRHRMDVVRATRRLRAFTGTYARIMERYDVLESPTLSEPAPPLGYLATNQPFETAFERIRAYAPFTPIHNAAGAPAISLPMAHSSTGLPIGVQFAAARRHDAVLLQLARALEAAHPFRFLPAGAG
jgi:amidase